MRKQKIKGMPILLSLNLTGNVVFYNVSNELESTLSLSNNCNRYNNELR